MFKILRLPFFAAMLLIFASCDSPPPAGPSLNFKRYQPIYMNVSGIDVQEEYRSPGRAPNVEHLMPYSPADAVQIWVKDRLRASGGNKTMQVIIKDASVVGKDIPSEGVFSFGSDKQYDARLEVEMRIYGDEALSEASINVVATRSMTMSDSASARTRDAAYRDMINDMMTTLNAELEKNIFAHLGAYVNFSMNP